MPVADAEPVDDVLDPATALDAELDAVLEEAEEEEVEMVALLAEAPTRPTP